MKLKRGERVLYGLDWLDMVRPVHRAITISDNRRLQVCGGCLHEPVGVLLPKLFDSPTHAARLTALRRWCARVNNGFRACNIPVRVEIHGPKRGGPSGRVLRFVHGQMGVSNERATQEST